MNLPEKLAREISRVTTLRCHYQAIVGTQGVNVHFALACINASLEHAMQAAGLEDVSAQAKAVADLESYKE